MTELSIFYLLEYVWFWLNPVTGVIVSEAKQSLWIEIATGSDDPSQ